MVPFFEAILYAQFHARLVQLNILAVWDKWSPPLDLLHPSDSNGKLALALWISNLTVDLEKYFLLRA